LCQITVTISRRRRKINQFKTPDFAARLHRLVPRSPAALKIRRPVLGQHPSSMADRRRIAIQIAHWDLDGPKNLSTSADPRHLVPNPELLRIELRPAPHRL
jgi:hypothetical protein